MAADPRGVDTNPDPTVKKTQDPIIDEEKQIRIRNTNGQEKLQTRREGGRGVYDFEYIIKI